MRVVLVASLFTFGCAQSWADPSPLVDRYSVTAPDGGQLLSARRSLTIQGRYDLRSSDGKQLATVNRNKARSGYLSVRGTDGRTLATARPNRLVRGRYDEFNSRGQRTGYWQQSKLTGDWVRYTSAGERVSLARPSR